VRPLGTSDRPPGKQGMPARPPRVKVCSGSTHPHRNVHRRLGTRPIRCGRASERLRATSSTRPDAIAPPCQPLVFGSAPTDSPSDHTISRRCRAVPQPNRWWARGRALPAGRARGGTSRSRRAARPSGRLPAPPSGSRRGKVIEVLTPTWSSGPAMSSSSQNIATKARHEEIAARSLWAARLAPRCSSPRRARTTRTSSCSGMWAAKPPHSSPRAWASASVYSGMGTSEPLLAPRVGERLADAALDALACLGQVLSPRVGTLSPTPPGPGVARCVRPARGSPSASGLNPVSRNIGCRVGFTRRPETRAL